MLSNLDLSSVTNRLLEVLQTANNTSLLWDVNGGSVPKFTIDITGQMPEQVRNDGDCQLTAYLFHVAVEPHTRNMPLTVQAAQPNRRQALGLSLYYLVSAFAKNAPEQEQQAMSIALKALHERPTYVDPINGFTFTITAEAEKPDEANRRWQSFSTPFRLSAVYRISVVFLTPQTNPPALAAPPTRLGLTASPAALPFAKGGALVATASRVDFAPIPPAPGDVITYDFSPAIVRPGGSFAVFGADLDQPSAQRLYLIDAGGAETDVTAWKAAAGNNAARVVLTLPAATGAPPGGAPEPGVYLLRGGDAATHRTNAVTLIVTPRVDPVPVPWTPAAGVFTFTGAGFTPGKLELLLDTVALAAIAPGGAPGAGEFAANAAGTSISFQVPAGLPNGTYSVRLRVKGNEGPPVGGFTIP